MGCISSKKAVSNSKRPAFDYSRTFRENGSRVLVSENLAGLREFHLEGYDDELRESKKGSSSSGNSLSYKLENLQKLVEGEQVAAGWPAWLSAVAGEAIHGWVPLRADNFEKLEKIGQGTYSSVFRARELESGRIVALKKVRFDNVEPESIRFMAREIMILRRLDHPNIIKLEGLITSRLSCSIYFVFEYMEHDLSGLLSCPYIKFSEPQVKCYMQQLLLGLEHCHSKGVMHRDIKGSNLLINNDGILKMADFGLANFTRSRHRQPLTSRVVTLWYRPPELLLGSTDYGEYVDLWSVGCVFAELLHGKPILKGRTEVEQLHKIFKLCGSPPDDYWKKSKLPHATKFKPQHPYESSLRETCKEFPTAALNMIETFLSVEPYKRGTASSALASKYFTTEPYACDPSSLPKYPPNKEIDAKTREAQRKKAGGRVRGSRETRKPNRICKAELQPNTRCEYKINGDPHITTEAAHARLWGEPPKPSINIPQKASHIKNASQGDFPFSGLLQVRPSSGFARVNRRKEDTASLRSHSRSSSRSQVSRALEPSSDLHVINMVDSKRQGDTDVLHGGHEDSRDNYSFDIFDRYHSQELSSALYQMEKMAWQTNNVDAGIEFSGPMLSHPHKYEELLERPEHHIRQAVRRSWFHRGKRDEN